MGEPQLARRYLVSGRVQGVAFRHHAKVEARALDVAGWVRNLPDGRVECRAQGSREQLERLEAFLRRGPAAARVDALELHEETLEPVASDGKRFVVRFD